MKTESFWPRNKRRILTSALLLIVLWLVVGVLVALFSGSGGRTDGGRPGERVLPAGQRWISVPSFDGGQDREIVYDNQNPSGNPAQQEEWSPEKKENVAAFAGGVVAGAIGLTLITQLLAIAVAAVAAWILFVINPALGHFAFGFVVGAVLIRLLKSLSDRLRPAPPENADERGENTTFGSAKWADLTHMMQHELIGSAGYLLGWFYTGETTRLPIHYTGTRHVLTVAPNGGGKGVAAIIPNLLTYLGSVLATDPKGELAAITAAQRRRLGQSVYILDPWGIVPGETSAKFNPLDYLDASDPDLGEKAMMLADAIVVKEGNGEGAFWDEEAKSLLNGLIQYVVQSPNFEGERTLATVRDLMNAPAEKFDAILEDMNQSPNPIVSSTAARTMAKTEKLRANVVTTLQAQTHFLDSPRIRENTSSSDFRFEDLKNSKMTVYLVLPADRLNAFSRWLRLMIQMAITATARNIEAKPERPVLFMLDEMAALGRLTMVEQAYGLMAGFGMQLWGVVQDLSQLDRIYGKGWETFISNSGAIQYFGSRDEKTASYFSKLCGVTTVEKWSFSKGISRALGLSGGTNRSTSSSNGGGSNSSGSNSGWSHTVTENRSMTQDVIQRSLVYPDELMVMRRDQSLLLVENNNPISAGKITWYTDARFKELGVNLQGRSGPAGPSTNGSVAKLHVYNQTGVLTPEKMTAAV